MHDCGHFPAAARLRRGRFRAGFRAPAGAVAAALAACAVLVAAAVVLLLRRFASSLPRAIPGERMLHQRPVPRVGGLAILAGSLPAALLAPAAVPGPWSGWLAAFAAVTLVSLADDARGVNVLARLAVHLAAAAGVAWLAFGPTPQALLAAVVIAWGANLYNFMDGSDGLAGTMGLAGFAAYALVAWHAGLPWVLFAAIALACIPFLAANRPPAALFMGDVGAVPLGFAAAGLGAAGVATGAWGAWFPALAFLPFLADASVTLALRALRGERVWRAHRSHFYQRLNVAGAGHRGTLAVYAALMLACATLAVACALLRPAAGWSALAVAALAHAFVFAAIDYHARKSGA